MTYSLEDELDDLMRDWAAQHAPSDAKLDDLARQIGDRLTNVPGPEEVVTVYRPPIIRKRRWAVVGGSLAAVVSVLVYVVRPFISPDSPEANSTQRANRGNAVTSTRALIGEVERSEKASLARELQNEFSGHFVWLLEAGDEMKLGLSAGESDRPARFVAVRYLIECQGPNDHVWRSVRTLDFVAQSEETVQTSLKANHGTNVAIWTYTTPDGMISVDSELVLAGPVRLRISSSRLLSSGAPVEIWQSEQNGVKYRVYQAAEVLNDEHLG